jgi:hypothetical protein
MQPCPEKLLIARSWKSFLAQLWPIAFTLFVFALGGGDWRFDVIFALIMSSSWMSRLFGGFFRTFVVMDDLGVSWITAPWPEPFRCEWREIEACARKNQDGRRILRFFLCRKTEGTPSGDPPGFRAPLRVPEHLIAEANYFDIDFDFADKPEESVETAFQACAGWIATREAGSTDRPIREFGEVSRSDAKKLADARKMEAAFANVTLSLAMIFIFLLIRGTWGFLQEHPVQIF